MKKFARFILIWMILSVLSSIGGYVYLNQKILPEYNSTTQIYIVPGETSEATLRASDGGLKDDFAIVFKSNLVIEDAKKAAGTSEDLASYITINTPANSNIVEIVCQNPDQKTAKLYVDAIAKSALKTTSIIPVEKILILSDGTSSGISSRPHIYRYTAYITVAAVGCWFAVELIVVLFFCAFKKKPDDDDEADYYRYYGKEEKQIQKAEKQIQKAVKGSSKKKAVEKTEKSQIEGAQVPESKMDVTASLEEKAVEKFEDAYEDDDYDEDELVLDESDMVEVDVLSDVDEDDMPSEIIDEESSAEVIARIPR